MDCCPPGSPVHGISQARILELVAISFSNGIFLTQGSSLHLLCLLHWQADSSPLSHQGSPLFFFYFNSKKSRLTVKAKKQIIGKHGQTIYEDLNHNNDILAKLFYFFLPSLFLFPQLGWVLRIYTIFSSWISPYSIRTYVNFLSGFTRGSDGKGSACNEGDLASVPGLGGSPGGGHGNPLQYSCLENPHGQRSLAG